jgi:hypothetical protein
VPVIPFGQPTGNLSDTIRLLPQNPHYFPFRGKTVALISSGEHYGTVLNSDFDYHRCLSTLQADSLTTPACSAAFTLKSPASPLEFCAMILLPSPVAMSLPGRPAARHQLRILGDFLRSFPLADLRPDSQTIRRAAGVYSSRTL